MMIYEKFFAERLNFLRTQQNVSAREMSLDIGQNESYINRIENGKSFPSMQVFFYICEYLNITPKEFWDTSNQAPQKIDEINKHLKKLNSEQLEILLNLIKIIH